MGEWRYSSTILDPLYTRFGGPQGRSGRCGENKNLAPVGIRTTGAQPVTRRYTDSACRAVGYTIYDVPSFVK
jgi:hypothetical protein